MGHKEDDFVSKQSPGSHTSCAASARLASFETQSVLQHAEWEMQLRSLPTAGVQDIWGDMRSKRLRRGRLQHLELCLCPEAVGADLEEWGWPADEGPADPEKQKAKAPGI